MPNTRSRGPAPEPADLGPEPARRTSVGVLLLITMLVATTVVAATIGLSFRWSSDRAASDAKKDARFQSELAAAGLETSVRNAQTSLEIGAAAPGLAAKLHGTQLCPLSSAGVQTFRGSHLDLIRPDGTVTCSSLAAGDAPPEPSHGSAPWIAEALRTGQPVVSRTAPDGLSGNPSVAIAAPVFEAGRPAGVLAAIIPVEAVADSLARTYASPREFTFTIVEPSAGVIRSVSGAPRAQEQPVGPTGFASAPAGTWKAPDGIERLFASSAAPTLGWRVYAGIDTNAVNAAVRDATSRQGFLAAAALLSLAAVALFVSRRIVRPLQAVTDAIVVARDEKTPAPVEVKGPREIAILADEFNTMIDARLGYESRLAERALLDELTGLPNRALLRDRLDRVLRRQSPERGTVAVLFLDLDRFKLVNDSFGHPVGDSLLRLVAARLALTMPAHDTLARFGGDDFVIVCEDVAGISGAVEIAARLEAALEPPFTLGGIEINVSARMGIALANELSDADELVREADIAMYQSKTSGRTWELWDEDLRARSAHRLELQQDLRSAVANDELVVMYQPIFDIEAWRVIGAEALVRWDHPRLGRLAPGRFIPLAEDSGQIAAVGQHVLEQACRFMGGLNRQGLDLSVSVNAAVAELNDSLLPIIEQTLASSGLDARHLCVEITESALVEAFGAGADALARIRGLGVHVAVDDFGTGYSSLSYLQHFPFDSLKIDKTFIDPLGNDDGRSSVLVEAIISMARAFQLKVVAEGVETPVQLSELRRLGCPYVQGFLLAEPMTASELETLVQRQAAGQIAAERPSVF